MRQRLGCAGVETGGTEVSGEKRHPRYGLAAAILLGLTTAMVLMSTMGGDAAAAGGTWPADPFNGLQITYSLSGAELGPAVDDYDFYTWTRSYEGALNGGRVTVSGSAVGNSGWSAALTVSLTDSKGNVESFEDSGERPFKTNFSVSIDVPPDVEWVNVRAHLAGDYNAGYRGVVVEGSLTRDYTPPPSPSPTDTVVPTATATPTVTPTPAYDIRISGVEVVQAVQCMDAAKGDTRCADNAMPLVQGKRAAVRVYVQTDVESGQVASDPAALIDGRVTLLSAPGGVLSSARGQPDLYHSVPDPSYSAQDILTRHREYDQIANLDFKLPLEAVSGNQLSLRVEINPDRTLPETDFDNNVQDVSLPLESSRGLSIMVFPVRSQKAGDGEFVAPAPSRFIHGYMSRIYPVGVGDLQLSVGPARTFRGEVLSERVRFLRWLNLNYTLPHLLGAKHAPDQLVGYTAFAAFDRTGWSDPKWMNPPGAGHVTFIIQRPGEGETLAHEIAHNLEQRHPSREPGNSPNNKACKASDPNSPWRYADARIQEPGFDPVRMKVLSPRIYTDFMSYCNRRWISPFHFHRLFMELLRLGPAVSEEMAAPVVVSDRAIQAGERTASSATSLAQATEYALVSGTLHRNMRAELDPLVRVTGHDAAPLGPTDGPFCLELRGGDATETRCFDVDFLDNEFEAVESESFFFTMPMPAGATELSLAREGFELAKRQASANAPSVTILEPTIDAVWDGPRTVRWSAEDLDGDPLEHSLLYSPDGREWLSLNVMVEETELTVDAGDLPGGYGGRIRVLVSDGFHTSAADVGPITVLPKAPRPAILEPVDGEVFGVRDSVPLVGSGFDPEDGALDPATFLWSSDRDGVLGMGRAVDVDGLSEGRHLITLKARDRDGREGKDTVVIRVERGVVFLPHTVKGVRLSDTRSRPVAPHPTETALPGPVKAERVIALINAERATVGLPALEAQSNLGDAAGWFAGDMARNDDYRENHIDRLGRDIAGRLQAFGYSQAGYVAWRVAENVAAGQTSPEEVVADWMASAPHRANILDARLCEAGVGYGRNDSARLRHYWALDFGCRGTSAPPTRTPGPPPTVPPTRVLPTTPPPATATARPSSTSAFPATATPRATATGGATPPGEPAIFGRVTVGGAALPGLPLELVHVDAARDTRIVMTTTLGAEGGYRFVRPAPLGSDEIYYVLYRNLQAEPSRVASWFGPDINNYPAGGSVAGGDFDLANIALLEPASGETVALPMSFTWLRRGLVGDDLRWVLVDPDSGQRWATPSLGDVTEYTLDALPDGVVAGHEYRWSLRVHTGPDSFGSSFYYHRVTFTGGGGGEDFQDGFCDPTSGWPSGENASLRYGYRDRMVGCEYYMAFLQAGRGWWATPQRSATDFDVAVNVALGGEGAAGLLFGQSQDGSSYTVAEIDAYGRYSISRYESGTWTRIVPPTASPAVDPDFGNRMAVEARGGTVVLRLDGTEVARVTGQQHAGKVGLYAESVRAGFEATFTDFRLEVDRP